MLLSDSLQVYTEHVGESELFTCEKRQFVRNQREHWSNDKRITVQRLKDWANFVLAVKRMNSKEGSVCLFWNSDFLRKTR